MRKNRINTFLLLRLILVLVWIVIFYFPLLFLPFCVNRFFYPLAINFFLWANRVKLYDLSETASKPKEAMIYASNHKCFADPIFVAKYIPFPFSFSMSSHVLDIIPAFKIIAFKMRFVGINKTNYVTLLRSYNKIKRRIRRGISLVFFPEGKYILEAPVGPLKGGISKIAKNTGIKVAPVAIYGIDQTFIYEKTLPSRNVYIKFGSPLEFKDFQDEKEFLHTLKNEIASLYHSIETTVKNNGNK